MVVPPRDKGRQRVSSNGRRRSIAGVVVAVVGLVAGLLVSPSPAAAADNPRQYFDGGIKYSFVQNCPSVIQGFPYVENGVGVYTGEYLDPDGNFPVVGDTTYLHIVAYGLGNPCAGQRVVPAIDLPPGIQLANPGNPDSNLSCANSLAPTPAPCAASVDLSTSHPYGGDYTILSGDNNNARTWGLPPGRYWEWVIAVKGSQSVTSQTITAHVKVLDGNSSPVLHATANGYIFGAAPQPAVFYDSPSTVASPTMPLLPSGTQPTAYGLWSQGNVFTNGQPGTVHLDFGTAANNLQPRPAAGVSVNNTGTSWNIWTDWAEVGFPALAHGTTYKWRLRFDPGTPGNPNDDTIGALQTFTTPTAETCRGLDVTVSMGLGQQPTTGDDVILGTPGSDAIQAGGGSDTVCAGGGNDSIDGGAGNDTIDGGAGRDNIIGGADSDTVIGGAGVDTASYAGATAAVTVTLGRTTAQNTGGGGTDTISTVENLTGGAKADRLTGNASANAFDGGAGSDRCDGKTGRDTQTRCETRISIP
jgi:hypothetical protein